MTPAQAQQEYGDGAEEQIWTWDRGELFGKRRTTIKDLLEMAETDDTVGAMLYAIETTLSQVEWGHQPCDNGKESDKPEAIAAAEFANSLFEDMEESFQSYIESAINFLVCGYSLAEILFRRRTLLKGSVFSDGFWGVQDIVERRQTSVSSWVVEEGRIVAFKQMGMGGEKTIPLWKTMHLKLRGGRNKPQGVSLFKNAFRSYLMKRRIQDSEAIGIERDLCGLPVMRMPSEDIEAATERPDTPEGKKAAARVKAARRAVSDMRMNEAGGLVLPSDTFEDDQGKPGTIPRYDFKIVTSAGSRTIDTRGAIREYDLAIARVGMMQFLRLGDRAGGSYALSDNQSTLALRAIRAIVRKIAQEWRRKVLKALWLLNGMDLRYLPILGHSEITEDSLKEIGEFLESIASAKDVLDEDPDLFEDMKRRLGPRRLGPRPAPRTRTTEPADDDEDEA